MFRFSFLPCLVLMFVPIAMAGNPVENLPEIGEDEVRLFIVRHAETFHSIDPSMDEKDPKYYALTPLGKKQSAAVGELIKDQPIHVMFTSLLERSKETLKYMKMPDSISVEEDRQFNIIPRGFFKETGRRMGFGDRIEIWKQNIDPTPIKGWSLRHGTAKFIQRLLKVKDAYGKAIVIVSHGDVMAGVIGSAEGYPAWERWENCAVPFGSLSVIDMKKEGPLYLHIKGYEPLEQ